MMASMAPKPARDLAGLGGAIAKFEHDWRQYEKLSGETLPDKLKIGALLKILPPAQASDIKWKFAGGLTSYSAMTEHIETYSQHIRMEGAFARGDNDVDMGSLDLDSYLAIAPSEEKAAFWEGMAAGMSQMPSRLRRPRLTMNPWTLCSRRAKAREKARARASPAAARVAMIAEHPVRHELATGVRSKATWRQIAATRPRASHAERRALAKAGH